MNNRIIIAALLTISLEATAADPVGECRERHAGNAQEHIACLEAALTTRDDSPAAQSAMPETSAESQTANGPVTSPNFQGSTESRVNSESKASPQSQPSRDSQARAEPGTSPGPHVGSESRTGPEPDATPAPVSGLGAEQVRDRQAAVESLPDEVQVHILSATYNARGLGTFRMADGQVWRETMASPERRRLKPDREYQARIKRGVVSGYRMHVEGVRYMMTVERVE